MYTPNDFPGIGTNHKIYMFVFRGYGRTIIFLEGGGGGGV